MTVHRSEDTCTGNVQFKFNSEINHQKNLSTDGTEPNNQLESYVNKLLFGRRYAADILHVTDTNTDVNWTVNTFNTTNQNVQFTSGKDANNIVIVKSSDRWFRLVVFGQEGHME